MKMSRLDEKLHALIKEAQGCIDDEEVKLAFRNAAIPEIKKAFIDSGWVSPEARDKVIESVNQIVSHAQSIFDRSEMLIPNVTNLTQGEPIKYLKHIDDDGTLWLGKTYPAFVDKGEIGSGAK